MTQRKKQNQKPQRIEIHPLARWLFPTVGNIALLTTLYFIFRNIKKFLLDGDTGVHIRIGDLIRQTGAVPHNDPFSFTMPGQEWVAWEWLADLFMSWIHNLFAIPGIVGASVLILCVLFMFLYHWMVARGADPITAAVLTVFAARISSIHWLARPHLLSLALLLAVAVILEDYRRRRSRWIYFLPVLTALWANLHGAFIVVFPIMAVYAGAELLNSVNQSEAPNINTRSALKTFLIVGLLSAGATFLTPYGWSLHQHIWLYLNNTSLLSSINEFQSPDFKSSTGSMVIIMLLLGAGALIQAFRKHRWVDIGLLIFWTFLMLQAVRHIPLAAIITLPIMAEHWSTLLREIADIFGRGRKLGSGLIIKLRDRLHAINVFSRQLSGIPVYIAIILFVIAVAVGPWGKRIFGPNFFSDIHPVRAAEFLATANLKGNIYAPEEYGDYLIYRLYPQTKVFIDGRNDFYVTGPVWKDYIRLSRLEPSWPEILKEYDVKYMLLQNNNLLGKIALESGRWEPVYQDKYSLILSLK